ncbi:hypothetical protein, partial [Pseudomonas sp. UBA7336]|uniref:hypothetical protein n=1 Tax=Pseudomonas sp. UBA7336 TaxID=1947338 RepID=UPI0025799681
SASATARDNSPVGGQLREGFSDVKLKFLKKAPWVFKPARRKPLSFRLPHSDMITSYQSLTF